MAHHTSARPSAPSETRNRRDRRRAEPAGTALHRERQENGETNQRAILLKHNRFRDWSATSHYRPYEIVGYTSLSLTEWDDFGSTRIRSTDNAVQPRGAAMLVSAETRASSAPGPSTISRRHNVALACRCRSASSTGRHRMLRGRVSIISSTDQARLARPTPKCKPAMSLFHLRCH